MGTGVSEEDIRGGGGGGGGGGGRDREVVEGSSCKEKRKMLDISSTKSRPILSCHWGEWECRPVLLSTHSTKIVPSLPRLNPTDVEERKLSWQRLTGLLRTYERLYCTDQVFLLEVRMTGGT